MYATCLYCNSNLGTNEVVEAFPVGRRLAFDAVHGRLWVVCRGCERWNLSPLEERWEAIEQAERLFHDTRLKVSTDNIGLARLSEGLELVRIGAPQRPEMAAWRYGDQFGRRRRRHLMWSGAAVTAAAGLYIGGAVAGISMVSFTGVFANGGMWDALIHGSPKKVVGHVMTADGELLVVQRRHARMSALLREPNSTEFELRLEHSKGTHFLQGAEAMKAAAQLLPTVNRFGGSKSAVGTAVSYLEEAGGATETLLRVQRVAGTTERMRTLKRQKKPGEITVEKLPGALHSMPLTQRLALEMALHEEQERRALEGELKELENDWRAAEEIAQISDSLLDTPETAEKLAELKAGNGRSD